MRLALICTDNLRSILTELLTGRNIGVDETSEVCLVESGCEIPRNRISILFELSNLNSLIELVDRLSRSAEDNNGTVIGRSGEETYEIIPYARICFFEGRGNHTYCITKDEEYRVREKLYELEEKLPGNRFIRVGKSFIVNIENVKQIVPWFGRRLVLKFTECKKEVEVSKNFAKSFKEFLDM